jgi:hypothetical protein
MLLLEVLYDDVAARGEKLEKTAIFSHILYIYI